MYTSQKEGIIFIKVQTQFVLHLSINITTLGVVRSSGHLNSAVQQW